MVLRTQSGLGSFPRFRKNNLTWTRTIAAVAGNRRISGSAARIADRAWRTVGRWGHVRCTNRAVHA